MFRLGARRIRALITPTARALTLPTRPARLPGRRAVAVRTVATTPQLAVPVHARYLARTIDVSKFQEHFAHSNMRRQTFERDSVMLTINTEERRGHVVVFNYGAVVFVKDEQDVEDEAVRLLGGDAWSVPGVRGVFLRRGE